MVELTSREKGIDWFLMELKWSREGLVASLLVDPKVEEFFVQISQNQQVPISTYGGKEWSNVGDSPLLSYAVSDEAFRDTNQFVLAYPSYSLISDRFPGKVNLSFLHLVGASQGLKFIMKTPISGKAKLDLRMMVERGMAEFVRQYLTFGKMTFRVSSYET